jgi:hypothetical protein
MKTVSYTQPLSDKDKLLIEFTVHKGKMQQFVAQYYSLVDLRWRTIMRIDNHHHGNRPHKHTYYYKKKRIFTYLNGNANEVFTEAKQQIVKNFREIKENYLMNN